MTSQTVFLLIPPLFGSHWLRRQQMQMEAAEQTGCNSREVGGFWTVFVFSVNWSCDGCSNVSPSFHIKQWHKIQYFSTLSPTKINIHWQSKFLAWCCFFYFFELYERISELWWKCHCIAISFSIVSFVWDAGTVIFQPMGLRCRCGKPSCVCLTSVFQHRYLHLNPIMANNDSHQMLPKTHNPQGQQGIVGDLITGWGSCRRRQVVLLCKNWGDFDILRKTDV